MRGGGDRTDLLLDMERFLNFAGMTTDDLLAALPASEDNRWEFKGAAVLESKEHLKRVLGKQVSAFSNSGGGYLVIGVSDDRQIEPCPSRNGKQSMKDFLSTMVWQSVDYPLQAFKIHPVPVANKQDKFVFVVAVEDSPASPHQSKEDGKYYYRIDGHTHSAPHFYLELLRNRVTRAVVDVVKTDYTIQTPSRVSGALTMNFAMHITVENKSLQSATSWGIHAKCCREDYRWEIGRDKRCLAEGVFVRGEQVDLLPSERAIATMHVSGTDHPRENVASIMDDFCVTLMAASNNHLGQQHIFHFDRSQVIAATRDVKQMMGW